MCDTPVRHTQNGLGTGETNDYSSCFQLPDGCITGWSTVGRSSWTVPKDGNVFFKDVNISWGQQVTVMFQIVSTLMEKVPAFALRMRELQGESPNVQLMDNPWGHVEHCIAKCSCQQSDRTGAYVHWLLPRPGKSDSLNDAEVSVEIENGFTFNNDCGYLGVGRPGSVPFVSEKPGAYGRLLLAVYVRWKTGLLISADWLRLGALGGRSFWTERANRTQCTARARPDD